MRTAAAAEIHSTLKYPLLINRLRAAFSEESDVPTRHHHTIPLRSEEDASLLLMPSWRRSCSIGVKIVCVFPGNRGRGLPTINGIYVLLDGKTGRPKAVLDAAALTVRRTAAASALASSLLSRPDSQRLLMVGAGALAPHLIEAHAVVRRLRRVDVWNRTPEKARQLALRLSAPHWDVQATGDLQRAAGLADVVSCATSSRDPLILGEWLKPGCHLDLVGAFTPEMREVDDRAVQLSRLFVDTRDGALQEAGDLLAPMSRGIINPGDVEADLFDLCRSDLPRPREDSDVTLFKSVGTALEDLAAAELFVERNGRAFST